MCTIMTLSPLQLHYVSVSWQSLIHILQYSEYQHLCATRNTYLKLLCTWLSFLVQGARVSLHISWDRSRHDVLPSPPPAGKVTEATCPDTHPDIAQHTVTNGPVAVELPASFCPRPPQLDACKPAGRTEPLSESWADLHSILHCNGMLVPVMQVRTTQKIFIL